MFWERGKSFERVQKWVYEMKGAWECELLTVSCPVDGEVCPGSGCWGWQVRKAFLRLTRPQVGLAWGCSCWCSGSKGDVTSYVTSAHKPSQHTLTVVQASKQNVLEELFWTSVKSDPIGAESVFGPGTQRKQSLITWACSLGIGPWCHEMVVHWEI